MALLLGAHAVVFGNYITMLDGIGLRGGKSPSTPLVRICPTMYADTQMWVRHALALADGAGPQLRHTDVDNAPYGREVHWNSAFAWSIAGAGWLRHTLTGEPLSRATENALAWFNLPLLLGVIVFFSWWVSRRVGLGGGVMVACAMVGNPDFYGGFAPNYVDHHGVLAAAVFGVVLGALFMGLGFVARPDAETRFLPSDAGAARRAAVMGAVCGAVGMWWSAATLIPAITIVGVAGAVVVLAYGSGAAGTVDPGVWRLWGRVGALLSLMFYFLEYAPHHLSLRLEVNNPVYAVGWWGAGELIAELAAWRLAAGFRAGRAAMAVAGLGVAPVVIAIGGARVFGVFDPFVARLSGHVAEGLSVVKIVQLFGWSRVRMELPWLALTLAMAVVLVWRAKRADRPVVAFTLVVLAGFLAMAFLQLRWWPSASGPEICVFLLGVAVLGEGRGVRTRWLCVAAPVAALFLPVMMLRIAADQQATARRQVGFDAMQPVYRDIAAALRASQPQGGIVLLASPNASVAVSYYGQFQSVGTLYWENLSGTKAAAEIFSASSEAEARRLIRARGITHVAAISQDNFLIEYFQLLHPDGTQAELQRTFGFDLLVNHRSPVWLEPIAYEVPPDAPLKRETVLLYRVRLGSPRAEAAFDAALAAIGRGELAAAESNIDAALASDPDSCEYALLKERLLLARGDVPGALAAARQAVRGSAPIQRPALAVAEGNRFYQQQQPAAAAELYRSALESGFTLEAANNLAWVLATSREDAVRNGPEALRWAERVVKENQAYVYLSAYAAALAECGRYAEAASVQDRVLELATATENRSLIENTKLRLQSYRAGRAWRE